MVDRDLTPEWRQVPGFPDYEVSDEGVIRRRIAHHRLFRALPAGSIVPQWLSKRKVQRKDGQITDLSYKSVSLFVRGAAEPVNRLVHRIVALTFLGPKPSEKHQVAHCDGDRFNNSARNLRWATGSENQRDRDKHGTSNSGSRHGMSKLRESDVRTIMSRANSGEAGNAIAADYGVTRATIYNIKAARVWKHITQQSIPASLMPKSAAVVPAADVRK